MRNIKYEYDILDDNLIRTFAKNKLYSFRNIVYACCLIISLIVLWAAFSKNVLTDSNSLFAEIEKRNSALLCGVMFLVWLFFFVFSFFKIKPLLKVLNNYYWCFYSTCNGKYISTIYDYDTSTKEDRSYSTHYCDIKGLNTNPQISKKEYETINGGDKCIAVIASDRESRQGKDVALVIKCNGYDGNKTLIKYNENEEG